MKIRLTPLNIVSAFSIMAALAILLNKSWLLSAKNEEFSGLVIALCLLVLFVSFLCDQIFRKFIPSLAKLWMMQLMMILLTAIFIVILKVSVFG